ncbi:MAG: WhiB family transcriptional regulator [Acidimicrobiales bacterium]|nr:WhiB family transcriptional regulator [Acidimicrobiales bacterium]
MNSQPSTTINQQDDGRSPESVGSMLSLLERPSWHASAACNGVGADVFFPGRGESAEVAMRFCNSCTVVTECLNSALEYRDSGVWAGTSGRQRRKIRRLPTRRPDDAPLEHTEQESA